MTNFQSPFGWWRDSARLQFHAGALCKINPIKIPDGFMVRERPLTGEENCTGS
jgi:hypothetical protein